MMRGFQLWVNLPAREKMAEPRYQEFAAERIPEAMPSRGVRLKIIAGEVAGTRGPVQQPATDPLYVDAAIDAGAELVLPIAEGHNAFAYVYEGQVDFNGEQGATGDLVVFGPGDHARISGTAPSSRFILAAGRPIGEPVARYGPFVMNTQAEIMQAVRDFQAGLF